MKKKITDPNADPKLHILLWKHIIYGLYHTTELVCVEDGRYSKRYLKPYLERTPYWEYTPYKGDVLSKLDIPQVINKVNSIKIIKLHHSGMLHTLQNFWRLPIAISALKQTYQCNSVNILRNLKDFTHLKEIAEFTSSRHISFFPNSWAIPIYQVISLPVASTINIFSKKASPCN